MNLLFQEFSLFSCFLTARHLFMLPGVLPATAKTWFKFPILYSKQLDYLLVIVPIIYLLIHSCGQDFKIL